MKLIRSIVPVLAVAASLLGAHSAQAQQSNEFTFNFTKATEQEKEQATLSAGKLQYGTGPNKSYISNNDYVGIYKGTPTNTARMKVTNDDGQSLGIQMWAFDKKIRVDFTKENPNVAYLDASIREDQKFGVPFLPAPGMASEHPFLRLIPRLNNQGLGVDSSINQWIRFDDRTTMNFPYYFRDRIISQGLDVNEILTLKLDKVSALQSVQLANIPRHSMVRIRACGERKYYYFKNNTRDFVSRTIDASEFKDAQKLNQRNPSEFYCPVFQFEVFYDQDGKTTLDTVIQDLTVFDHGSPKNNGRNTQYTYQSDDINNGLRVERITVRTK